MPMSDQAELLKTSLKKPTNEELPLDETFMEKILYDFFATHEVVLNDERVPLVAMPLIVFEYLKCTDFQDMMDEHEKLLYESDLITK